MKKPTKTATTYPRCINLKASFDTDCGMLNVSWKESLHEPEARAVIDRVKSDTGIALNFWSDCAATLRIADNRAGLVVADILDKREVWILPSSNRASARLSVS